MAVPVTRTQAGAGSSAWANPNFNLTPFALTLLIENTGTAASGTVDITNDEFWVPGVSPNVAQFTTISAVSGTIQVVEITDPITGWRITNGGSGTLTAQGVQAGICNY